MLLKLISGCEIVFCAGMNHKSNVTVAIHKKIKKNPKVKVNLYRTKYRDY